MKELWICSSCRRCAMDLYLRVLRLDDQYCFFIAFYPGQDMTVYVLRLWPISNR